MRTLVTISLLSLAGCSQTNEGAPVNPEDRIRALEAEKQKAEQQIAALKAEVKQLTPSGDPDVRKKVRQLELSIDTAHELGVGNEIGELYRRKVYRPIGYVSVTHWVLAGSGATTTEIPYHRNCPACDRNLLIRKYISNIVHPD